MERPCSVGIRSERVEAGGGDRRVRAFLPVVGLPAETSELGRLCGISLVRSSRRQPSTTARPGGDAPVAGWGKFSERVNAWNGENPESVKRVLSKMAQVLTHSTLQYVSPVAFEHATPLHLNKSPPLETPFFRVNSKMVMHRQIKGTPKTAVVKRTPTGKWFVNITVELCEKELQEQHVPHSEEEVGIDVGLKTFAYLSTEEAIANPRFFREEEAKLARAQRNLSKAPKGSNERECARKIVARTHERIANRRKNFIEQEVCKLVARFGFIAIEALVVRNMVKNPKLAKSIADVSWSMFFTRLVVKAEEAGRHVVKVDPAYTSQTCSACGHRQPMPLSVRLYECPQCGLVIHRDHNGSLNILADARQAVGRHSRVIPEAPGLQPWGVVTF